MARRRGFIRRLFDNILSRRPQVIQPKPTTSAIPPVARSIRQRAIDNMVATGPLSNIGRIRDHVKYMTDDELRWTATASGQQIAAAARQFPDRLDDNRLPLNPWWYR